MTNQDEAELVVGKHDGQFVIFEKDDERDGVVTSRPRKHTLWYEEGRPWVVTSNASDVRPVTPQEAEKYVSAKESMSRSINANIIWDAKGLMMGNYVRRSDNSYWVAQFRGTITRLTIDELILIDTQVPRNIFEYIDLDHEWLDQFGFIDHGDYAVHRVRGIQVDKRFKEGGTEYWYASVRVRHVHKLQNLVSELDGMELVRRDGKR